MSFFSKNDRPRLQEIVLSDKHRKLRIVLLCVVLAIGITALVVGLTDALNVDPGWQEIKVATTGIHCGDDFAFQYYFSDGSAAQTAIQKELVTTYSACARDAYWMFTPDQEDEGHSNVYAINHSVGQTVTVNPVLYNAFALLEQQGSRAHYLGPIYRIYQSLCFSDNDQQAADRDPGRDADMAQYAAKLAAFARNEAAISLELMGNNQVRLQVSAEYQAFAAENEIENYLDFYWMANAFIIDYFADTISAKGYTKGYFVSRDGYTRNLCQDVSFNLNLFDRVEDTVLSPGVLSYRSPMNMVVLRDYPISQWDDRRYYTYDDGGIVSGFVDIQDGQSRCATSDLVAYSTDMGCAEILLQVAPAFVGASFDAAHLQELSRQGVDSIWTEDLVIYHTAESVTLENLLNQEGYSYRVQQAS